MKSKLPPLAWFRAFESAARHLNMTVAAQELGLTQPAVSQQIQLLEHRFNMTLFERRPRGLALTDSGRRLLPQVSESIDGLTRLIAEFDTQQETNRLNIAASASFARGYITPILPGFLELHPSLRVRIKTTLWHDDYLNSDADLEIRFGSSNLAGKGAFELCHDRVVAVCAPDFFAQPPNWATICAAPRIQTVVITETWERWAAALNLSQPQGELHLVDAHGLGIDFALSGTGVVLTSLLIAAPYLLSQELIMPHEGYVDANERYFLATNPTTDNLFAKPLAEQIRQHSKKMMQTAADKFLR
jgi:LysR family glycine cleavage system transcriptional activator|tara:strand:- start:1689 stop:2594 length:906 start_codon:yes stop_codon:yes gene_type:complete